MDGLIAIWTKIIQCLICDSCLLLQWTDDTSMALCLCESLVECQGYNPVDQNKRYWKWYQVYIHVTSTLCDGKIVLKSTDDGMINTKVCFNSLIIPFPNIYNIQNVTE